MPIATSRPVVFGRLKLSVTLRSVALLWQGRCPSCGRKIQHGWHPDTDHDQPQHRASHCLRCSGDYLIALHPIHRTADLRTVRRFLDAPRPPLKRDFPCSN
jgi:hypothetical protein